MEILIYLLPVLAIVLFIAAAKVNKKDKKNDSKK